MCPYVCLIWGYMVGEVDDEEVLLISTKSKGDSNHTRCCTSFRHFAGQCCDESRLDSPRERRNKWMRTSFEVFTACCFQYGFQYVIHNPTCNFLFRCGCTWEWNGGWKNCNIWDDGPKCPWCMSRAYVSWTTDYFIFFLMFLTYLYLLYHR